MDDDSLEILKSVSEVNQEFLSRQLSSVTEDAAFKSFGRLTYPSDDLFKVCKECESLFRRHQ